MVEGTPKRHCQRPHMVLVIIPALSLAYLFNLGPNKALWNTICTNRHFKSYSHQCGSHSSTVNNNICILRWYFLTLAFPIRPAYSIVPTDNFVKSGAIAQNVTSPNTVYFAQSCAKHNKKTSISFVNPFLVSYRVSLSNVQKCMFKREIQNTITDSTCLPPVLSM